MHSLLANCNEHTSLVLEIGLVAMNIIYYVSDNVTPK